MEVLRIKLKQTKAHYRKEETVENKMTYPLPPFSTVIGGLHKACDFKEYQEMKISIQGRYKNLSEEVHTEHIFLKKVEGDRGILVKVPNENILSKGFIKVAEAKKKTGSSFIKETTIGIHNRKLLEEYKELREIKSEDRELAKYKALITSLGRWEILNEVELIIHISSSSETLETIEKNINNLKAIGRSEDFVDVEECKIVETIPLEEKKKTIYSAYIKLENISKGNIRHNKTNEDGKIGGTLYYLNKNYKIVNGKREFEKHKVVYTSNYIATQKSENILFDGEYIIDLV